MYAEKRWATLIIIHAKGVGVVYILNTRQLDIGGKTVYHLLSGQKQTLEPLFWALVLLGANIWLSGRLFPRTSVEKYYLLDIRGQKRKDLRIIWNGD